MNNYFMRKITLFLFLLLCANGMCQRHEVLDESIASLQVVADDNWLSLPMIELRSHQHINIGFDDLSHTYRRFAYKIEHCESDWTVSYRTGRRGAGTGGAKKGWIRRGSRTEKR